ncbi:MAG: hypothetical protein JW947_09670 [Sedimentisphaerales bacterium]|nr:hypothetical protein [Sedimentisphaerales bacterium]
MKLTKRVSYLTEMIATPTAPCLPVGRQERGQDAGGYAELRGLTRTAEDRIRSLGCAPPITTFEGRRDAKRE